MAVSKANTSKTSATSEVVLGKAAGQLADATNALKGAVALVEGLEQKAKDNALTIANQEEKIAALAVEFAEKERQAKLDLDLKVKENQTKVVTDVLATQSKIAVKQEDFNALQDELTTLKTEFADKVKAEVGKAEGIAKSRFEKERELLEAQQATKEAGNVAEIKNLNQQVAVYKQQAEDWKKQLDDERKAGTERAKAGAIGTMNVGAQEATGRR
jgi:hypothetical protein